MLKNNNRCSWSESSPTVEIMLEDSSVWASQTSLWNHNQFPKCLLQPACSMPYSCTLFPEPRSLRFSGHMLLPLPPIVAYPASGPTGKQAKNNLSPLPILAIFPLFLPCIPKVELKRPGTCPAFRSP